MDGIIEVPRTYQAWHIPIQPRLIVFDNMDPDIDKYYDMMANIPEACTVRRSDPALAIPPYRYTKHICAHHKLLIRWL